jgi:hypothetical protein
MSFKDNSNQSSLLANYDASNAETTLSYLFLSALLSLAPFLSLNTTLYVGSVAVYAQSRAVQAAALASAAANDSQQVTNEMDVIKERDHNACIWC